MIRPSPLDKTRKRPTIQDDAAARELVLPGKRRPIVPAKPAKKPYA